MSNIMGRHGRAVLKQFEQIRDSGASPSTRRFLFNNTARTFSFIRDAESAGRANMESLRAQGERTAIRIIVAIPFACALLGFIGYQLIK